jgi:hypothetical protein
MVRVGILFLCLICRSSDAEFDKFRREVPKLPSLVSSKPLYGILLFGTVTERCMWAVFDKSAQDSPVYDVLYLDLDADGDLRQDGERFRGRTTVADTKMDNNAVFEVGRVKDPATGREHTEFTITWRPNRVSCRMKWLGDKMTQGMYGPSLEEYANFSTSPHSAPVLIPGHDRPFQFEHWMSGTLKRSEENDFKVFMGNIGSGRGTFCAVNDKFLPPDDYVVATLVYSDKSGAEKQARFELKKRC